MIYSDDEAHSGRLLLSLVDIRKDVRCSAGLSPFMWTWTYLSVNFRLSRPFFCNNQNGTNLRICSDSDMKNIIVVGQSIDKIYYVTLFLLTYFSVKGDLLRP